MPNHHHRQAKERKEAAKEMQKSRRKSIDRLCKHAESLNWGDDDDDEEKLKRDGQVFSIPNGHIEDKLIRLAKNTADQIKQNKLLGEGYTHELDDD